MKEYTLRKIDPDFWKRVNHAAVESDRKLNRFLLDALDREATRVEKKAAAK